MLPEWECDVHTRADPDLNTSVNILSRNVLISVLHVHPAAEFSLLQDFACCDSQFEAFSFAKPLNVA